MSEVADRYRRLAARFTTVVDAVPDDAWDRPSPCEGWSALEVVGHVASAEWDFLSTRGLAPEGMTPSDDPRGAWPEVRDTVQEVLDDPSRADAAFEGFFGATTIAAAVDRFYAMDLVVHAWDLARAAGLREMESMPADEVERIFADALELGDNLRQPGVCGPVVDVGPDADRQDQLLGYLGRQP